MERYPFRSLNQWGEKKRLRRRRGHRLGLVRKKRKTK